MREDVDTIEVKHKLHQVPLVHGRSMNLKSCDYLILDSFRPFGTGTNMRSRRNEAALSCHSLRPIVTEPASVY